MGFSDDMDEHDEYEREMTLPDWWTDDQVETAIAGGLDPAIPVCLPRVDGVNLLYPGLTHTFVGESEALKTWVNAFAVSEELKKGHHVIYLDYENGAKTILRRLKAFGHSDADLKKFFHYYQMKGRVNKAVLGALKAQITECGTTLVVLDGVGTAMALEGLDDYRTEGIAKFYKKIPEELASYGPAFSMIDHVTKDKEGRGRYAIGGIHKLNGLTGAGFLVALTSEPFARGRHATSSLILAKDREEFVERHAIKGRRIGTFNITSDDATGEIEAWIDPPSISGAVTASGKTLSDKLLIAICELVRDFEHEDGSKGLAKRAAGKPAGRDADEYVNFLLGKGCLEERKYKGGKRCYFLKLWNPDADLEEALNLYADAVPGGTDEGTG